MFTIKNLPSEKSGNENVFKEKSDLKKAEKFALERAFFLSEKRNPKKP